MHEIDAISKLFSDILGVYVASNARRSIPAVDAQNVHWCLLSGNSILIHRIARSRSVGFESDLSCKWYDPRHSDSSWRVGQWPVDRATIASCTMA
jgi:hypothetical protein